MTEKEYTMASTDLPKIEKTYSCNTCGQTVKVVVESQFFSMFVDRNPRFCPLCGRTEITELEEK